MQKPSFYSMVEAINFLKVEEGNKFLKVKGPEQSKIRIQFRKNSQAMDKWTPPRTKFEPNDPSKCKFMRIYLLAAASPKTIEYRKANE